MLKSQSYTISNTDAIAEVVSHLPQTVAEMLLTSISDMACFLIQTGDMEIEIVGDKRFKIIVYAKSGIRTQIVNLVPD